MLVETKAASNFELDPIIEDLEVQVDARIVGIVHIGLFEKQKHDGKKFIEEYTDKEQAIIEFEIVEDGTQVERGTEGDMRLENRKISKFITYSSHENAEMHKIAKAANPKSAWVDGKQGKVDTSLIIGEPVALQLGINKAGDRNTVVEVNLIQPKHKAAVNPMESKPFQYSVMSGAHPLADGTPTTIEAIPKWMLKQGLTNAKNAEEFTMIDEIEEYTQESADGSDAGTLEGDEKAKTTAKTKTTKSAAKPKTTEPVEEEVVEEDEVVEEAVKEPAPKTTRRRRASKPAVEKEDFSGLTLEELEDVLLSRFNVTDDQLAELDDKFSEDDEGYHKSLLALADEAQA